MKLLGDLFIRHGLQIRAIEVSVTAGDKNKPFSLVPNGTKNTTLFSLDVRSLGVFGLRYNPQGGTYGRISPARSMTVEEFNNSIQNTAGLWKPR